MSNLNDITNQMPQAPNVSNQQMFTEGRIDANPEVYPEAPPPSMPNVASRFKRKGKATNQSPQQNQQGQQLPQQGQQLPQQNQQGQQLPQQNQQGQQGQQQQFQQGQQQLAVPQLGLASRILSAILIICCSLAVPALVIWFLYTILVSNPETVNRPTEVLEHRGLSEIEKRAVIDEILLRAKAASPISVEVTEDDLIILMDKFTWTYDEKTKIKESHLKDGSRMYLKGKELIYILPEK